MRQLVVATTRQPLLLELEALAALHNAQVVCPDDFVDLVFSDAVALVVDPRCLSQDTWHSYMDYLLELGGEDATPLVVLKHRDEHEPLPLPERIASKPEGTLHRLYDDDTAAVSAIVEEALLATHNQWNMSPQLCTAPGLTDVEASYIATHLPDGYVVVVARPEYDKQTTFRHIAELAGFTVLDWAGAAFLTFTFAGEEDARSFAARIPAGMATLYAQGKYLEENC